MHMRMKIWEHWENIEPLGYGNYRQNTLEFIEDNPSCVCGQKYTLNTGASCDDDDGGGGGDVTFVLQLYLLSLWTFSNNLIAVQIPRVYFSNKVFKDENFMIC